MDRAERTDYAGQPTFGGTVTELEKAAEELIRTAEGAAKHAYLDGVAEGRKQVIAETTERFVCNHCADATIQSQVIARFLDSLEPAKANDPPNKFIHFLGSSINAPCGVDLLKFSFSIKRSFHRNEVTCPECLAKLAEPEKPEAIGNPPSQD
jgi:hypothetical protein